MKLAMLYTVMIYGTETPPPFGEKKKSVETVYTKTTMILLDEF